MDVVPHLDEPVYDAQVEQVVLVGRLAREQPLRRDCGEQELEELKASVIE